MDFFDNLDKIDKMKILFGVLLFSSIISFFFNNGFTNLISTILLIYLLYLIYKKDSTIISVVNDNSYDEYSINNKSNINHYHINIKKSKLDSDFLIIKKDNNSDFNSVDSYNNSDYDFYIDYKLNEGINIVINTLNVNLNNNTNLYDYSNQEDNLTFNYSNHINTNTDLSIDLILDHKFIYLLINSQLVKYNEMDYFIKNDFDFIYSQSLLIDNLELYNDINYNLLN